MPMLRMAMYAKGIQIYCAPTADDRETWLPTMRHIALEGRCFVLSACQFLRRSDLPMDIPNQIGDEPDTILLRGGAAIIDPLGAGARRAHASTRKRSSTPSSTSTTSRGASTTSTLPATTRARTCSS